LGARIRQSVLEHIDIDDDHLNQEARELPQLLFYYNAAYSRVCLKQNQTEIKLEEAESNSFIIHRSSGEKVGKKIGVEELKALVILDPNVQSLKNTIAELESKKNTIRGVLDALRQKGYSLTLIASIRGKEEDWLRLSFADRFRDNPKRENIASALNQMLGDNLVT